MARAINLLIILLVFSIPNAFAHYYDTLPKGVRLFGYRFVQTGKISDSFNSNGDSQSFQFSVDANTETLSGVNQALDAIFGQINANKGGNLSFGAYQIDGDSVVKVHGTGFGYGVTDRLTAFVSIPRFNAEVNVRFKQNKKNNGAQVSDNINQNTNDDIANIISNAVQYGTFLLDSGKAVGEITQGILVNNLGYKSVGNWNGTGLGDMELGALYRIYKDSEKGFAVAGGTVLPTGRVDDPDILQDVGFGDGQFDLYAEAGGGYHLHRKWFVNAFTRYTYQLEGKRSFRLPYDSGGLTDRKERIRFKLGNRFQFHTDTEYVFSDWMSFIFGYEVTMTGKSKFYSSDETANQILAQDTDSMQHEFIFTTEVSSITPFLKKKFLLPAKINFTYRPTIGGRNVVNADRYEVEFRMMF